MAIKILFCIYSIFLVAEMVGNAQGFESDALAGYSYQKVNSVENMSLEQKISLILVPTGHRADGSMVYSGLSKNNAGFWKEYKVLNITEGFRTSDSDVPFPDCRAIQNINDYRMKSILRDDLIKYLSDNNARGVLASSSFLFESFSYPSSWLNGSNSYALWLFSDVRDVFLSIPVTWLPDKLFSGNEPLSIIPSQKNDSNVFSPWVDHSGGSDIHFEKRIRQGTLFLTSDYESDFTRLVRAYRNKMLIEDDLDEGCRKILDTLGKSGKQKNFTTEKQITCWLKEYARRRTFEEGIHLFKRRESPFLPSDLRNISIKLVSDIADSLASSFISMAENHYTITVADSARADYVFWLYGNKPLTGPNLKTRAQKIRNENPDAEIALFLGDPCNYFEKNTIPESVDAVFTGTSNWSVVWEYLSQAVFSGINTEKASPREYWLKGIRPLSVRTQKSRLKFGVPEEVAMRTDSLLKIDTLMWEAIKEKAIPGGQVLVARDGVVVWNKAYGNHTYKGNRKVAQSDIYDLASITKIAATLPSLMKLYDQKRWSLSDTLGAFFPEVDTTDKASITIRDILLHESGLVSYIPFYLDAIDKEKLKGSLFSRRFSWLYNIKLDDYVYLNRTVSYREDVFQKFRDQVFSVPVADKLYMNKHYLDTMFVSIITSPLRRTHDYLYSDVGFYFLGEMVHRLSGKPLNYFAAENFFEPLGMINTSFLPLNHFDKERIVPTENDKAFRKQLLHGWVHDPGAAMMGGVAGHAGLFSNAGDVAKMMQMFLNDGRYGGKEYLNASTVELFTKRYNGTNRRGLGFDKPEPDTSKVSPASRLVSSSSFGHSGFTGTLAWADPENGIIYVFLSNRVHPDQYNKKLIENNYRTRIQDIVYHSIIRKKNDD
ncbi:MAG: serine-type D-Ala-D-Ala carboxypeptidase [Anaerophaga sp.]|uniref:serine hydrolase domain-containing protein n=1 Tax=Anaerophaga thermohalophila TaxID=177400 RepID=UPI000237BC83|nr:serine hydrolase [Anaerophaga thermohalophila]MDN5291340.1 serine-type D-Ala-D-Ala carboxypeptidase [Anaerophaga sp.]